jgi:hypothetical protein
MSSLHFGTIPDSRFKAISHPRTNSTPTVWKDRSALDDDGVPLVVYHVKPQRGDHFELTPQILDPTSVIDLVHLNRNETQKSVVSSKDLKNHYTLF